MTCASRRTWGSSSSQSLTPEVIARWQAKRVAAGAGRSSIHKTLTLLGGILQRGRRARQDRAQPCAAGAEVSRPARREVRPLAPAIVEAMRGVSRPRDAMLISVLAYAGLRPQEALALRWADVRERTILVERAVSLGEEKDTKTHARRTVRLLAPLLDDLLGVADAVRAPAGRGVGLPRARGAALVEDDLRQLAQAGVRPGGGEGRRRPCDAVHAAALVRVAAAARGSSVIYVARQLAHDARLTLGTYRHVIDELDEVPRIAAEDAIRAARGTRCVSGVSEDVSAADGSGGSGHEKGPG
jgi:integrase